MDCRNPEHMVFSKPGYSTRAKRKVLLNNYHY